ncbi:hypothetical protein ONZ51_g7450 [Trametes cubensis]|uniref:C2H2-type domain-containing protein n=1 Tax=Trametes cubensis TaxID=1111947 RepID=A0AAD7TQ42_9APHY|nr:hypothetical protein ONZ51_g7450 [Trametes cubensis]
MPSHPLVSTSRSLSPYHHATLPSIPLNIFSDLLRVSGEFTIGAARASSTTIDQENDFVQGCSTDGIFSEARTFPSFAPHDITQHDWKQDWDRLSTVTDDTFAIDPRLLVPEQPTASTAATSPFAPFTFESHSSPYYFDYPPSLATTPALTVSDEDVSEHSEAVPPMAPWESDTVANDTVADEINAAMDNWAAEAAYIATSSTISLPELLVLGKRKREGSEPFSDEPVGTTRQPKRTKADVEPPATAEESLDDGADTDQTAPVVQPAVPNVPEPRTRGARRTKDDLNRYLNAVPVANNLKHLQRHYEALLRGAAKVDCLWPGCGAAIASNQMNAHVAQKHLGFTYHCPLKDSEECPWTGTRGKDTRQHLRVKHSNRKNLWPEEFR